MSADDILFVECVMLGITEMQSATTWKVFLQNVTRSMSAPSTRRRPKRRFYCQVINTDAVGKGRHWLQATARILDDGPLIKILEPYDKTSRACSSHVKQEFKRQFPGTYFSFEYTGFQKADDGSHCGHISTWSDLTYRLALMHGCDFNEWHPDPPPDL